MTEHNGAAVGEICRRLDGLPLAIELAAARTRLFEAEAMLAPLQRRLELLKGGARDAPARQQTLRSTISWSYGLLEPAEQALFRHLAVFVGGCSLEAALAICEDDDIVDHVESLVAKNLLRSGTTPDGAVRLSMLETIREFGLEQLAWTGELEPLRHRHAEYFVALAERAEPELGGPRVGSWLATLEREHDNLRAALEWGVVEAEPRRELALRLAGALTRFWWMGGHFGEGSRWFARALAGIQGHTRPRMKALHGAGWLAHFQRDSPTARARLEESLAIAEHLDDDWWRAWVLHTLGRVAYFDYDAQRARELGERSLRIAEAVGDPWLIAWTVHLLALAAYIAGDHPRAYEHYARSLAIRRELGHLEGMLIVLHLQGMAAQRMGKLDEALALNREALAVARQINSGWFYRSVLPLFVSLAAERQPAVAARLGGWVAMMSEASRTLPIPITEAAFNAALDVARRKLGEDAFEAAWAEGRAMSLEAVVAEGLTVEVRQRPALPARLTPAEVEVLRRLARGCTTREIADDLVVAVSTVDRHITHIYAKIGQRGRAAAATFALKHGLM